MALRYHTYLYYLQRLGLAAGFMKLLCGYDIRRGAGEAVDGTCIYPARPLFILTGFSRCDPGSTPTGHGPQGRRSLPGLYQRAGSG